MGNLIAWVFSILVLAITVLTQVQTFRPEVLILGLTLVAIIWYTYFTHKLISYHEEKDKKELERKKESRATILIEELRGLYAEYLELFALNYNPNSAILLAPTLKNIGISNSEIFESSTVSQLAQFYNYNEKIRKEISNTNQPQELEQLKPKFVSSCHLISSLIRKLEEEGGDKNPQILTRTRAQIENAPLHQLQNYLPAHPFRE